MHNILKVKSKIKDYDVIFVEDLSDINNIIDQPNTITFIDSNVNILYPSLNREDNIIVKCIEKNKTLSYSEQLIGELSKRNANINTKLVVIGGGILQDLVGFIASIYCRGIEYILVPTTLLAQVDSCVGGKTSINIKNKKNILGTFYPPYSIMIYSPFISTLSNLDVLSGMGEIYKFHILQDKIDSFCNNNSHKMFLDSLTYKIDILSRDEFDKGERKFLNFGHTFGHALESTSNNVIPHGIAVILGCIIATEVSFVLGYDIPGYNNILAFGYTLIDKSKIKFKSEWFNPESLLKVIKSDKKSTGKLTMVLVDDKPFLEDIEDVRILDEILNDVYESIGLCNTILKR